MQSSASLPKVTPAARLHKGGRNPEGASGGGLSLDPIIAVKGYGFPAPSATVRQERNILPRASKVDSNGANKRAGGASRSTAESTLTAISKKPGKKSVASASTNKAVPVIAKSPSDVKSAAKEKSLSARAIRLLAEPSSSSENTGKVPVKFNHYNKRFPIHNGVLKWKDIDEEYAFSFVYKGNYSRRLFLIPEALRSPYKATTDDLIEVERDENGEYFLNLISAGEYVVQVNDNSYSCSTGYASIFLKV
jgi:hypothetical protein